MKEKKRNKTSQWQDHYTRLAQKEHYPARSIYKLAEIQKKHHIIARGDRVLDLGCAPGSWLLFAAEQTGAGGSVVGVDLKPVTVRMPSQVRVIAGDVHELRAQADQLAGSGFQVVLSDMAPSTTGDKFGDAVRSFELSMAALTVADEAAAARRPFCVQDFSRGGFQTLLRSG